MAFVIGDSLSDDQLCGIKNYSPHVTRISQTFSVPFKESNNPH